MQGRGPDQARLDAAHPVQLRGEGEQRCCALLQQSCAQSDSQVRRYFEGGLEEPAVVPVAALYVSATAQVHDGGGGLYRDRRQGEPVQRGAAQGKGEQSINQQPGELLRGQ